MRDSLRFALGLLGQDTATASAEDLAGEHGAALRLWQKMGFLAAEPGLHPVPSCPHCREGVPSLLSGRYICDACLSPVDARHLHLWRFDLGAFLAWLARKWKLAGDVRPVGETLWQLGSLRRGDLHYECFFCLGGPLTDAEAKRLLAFRSALVVRALPRADPIPGFHGPCFSLLEALRQDGRTLRVMELSHFLQRRGTVRFDEASGALWAGDTLLGEVPVGGKEHALLARLAEEQDRYVSYGDLKHAVLARTGSTDSADEATFCQKFKGRIKDRWVAKIDLVIVTTNKGNGYRLRGAV